MAVTKTDDFPYSTMRKITKSFRSKIRRQVKEGTSFSLWLVIGCESDKLKQYIESNFEEGMNWENYGDWWFANVQNVRDVNFTDLEQFMAYFNYESYKPIWKTEFGRGGGTPVLNEK